MELRQFAHNIFFGPTLQEKLAPPPEGLPKLTDDDPGQSIQWTNPTRDERLSIAPKKARKTLPHPQALHDPAMRARCLHLFANHELMAVELMAWAILAYTDAPRAFRRGLAWLIVEEQRHVQLYVDRLADLGVQFGDQPLNDHFWRVAEGLTTPLEWVCAMNLTFEQANLDHAPIFEEHFRKAGDEQSAQLMAQIQADEVHHVAFGIRWLKHFAPNQNTFETYIANLTGYNSPDRARGKQLFNEQARRAAGLDDDFIEQMRQLKA